MWENERKVLMPQRDGEFIDPPLFFPGTFPPSPSEKCLLPLGSFFPLKAAPLYLGYESLLQGSAKQFPLEVVFIAPPPLCVPNAIAGVWQAPVSSPGPPLRALSSGDSSPSGSATPQA